MKLLSKNEVELKKQIERKTELDEGLRIAKKIDEYRLELQKAEQDLHKFKTSTVKIVQSEIDELIRKKEELTWEIQVLTKQNDTLKKPFDEEWEMIKEKKIRELDEKLYASELKEKELAKREFDFALKEKDVNDAEIRVRDQDKRSEQALESARKREEEAQEILNNAKIRDAQIQSEIDAKSNAFKQKEEKWVAWETDLRIREEALKRSVRELVNRERFINDKYKTLLRTQEALKNK